MKYPRFGLPTARSPNTGPAVAAAATGGSTKLVRIRMAARRVFIRAGAALRPLDDRKGQGAGVDVGERVRRDGDAYLHRHGVAARAAWRRGVVGGDGSGCDGRRWNRDGIGEAVGRVGAVPLRAAHAVGERCDRGSGGGERAKRRIALEGGRCRSDVPAVRRELVAAVRRVADGDREAVGAGLVRAVEGDAERRGGGRSDRDHVGGEGSRGRRGGEQGDGEREAGADDHGPETIETVTVLVYVPARTLAGTATPTVALTSILPMPVFEAALKNLTAAGAVGPAGSVRLV